MPTVKRDAEGYNIVSFRHGKYITHQLTPDGVSLLQMRRESIDELAIDVNTLMYLREKGYAYIRGKKQPRPRPDSQQRFRWKRKPAHKESPSQPVIADSPAPLTIACPKCRSLVAQNAAFCGRCGAPMNGSPAAQPRQGHAALIIGIIALVLAAGLIGYAIAIRWAS